MCVLLILSSEGLYWMNYFSRILDLLYRSRDSAGTMFKQRGYARLVTVPINFYADLFLLQLYAFQYMIVIRKSRV